ncbi:TIGR00180 family glycosyltransferase [Thermodesulfobacteriota bacterium]
MKQKFSIVIPTFNRSRFLGRLLQYYKEVSLPSLIVVADSSCGDQLEKNRRFIKRARGVLNIRHDEYTSQMNFSLKIAQSLTNLESEYVGMCGDDDFITPRAIEKCVKFLEQNPEYTIVHGRAIRVVCVTKSSRSSGMRIVPSTYRQRSIDDEKSQVRLKRHLADYTPTFYSIHHLKNLQHDIKIATNHFLDNINRTKDNASDYHFYELLLSCLSLIQGKSKCLDMLYMVRQVHPNSTARGSRLWPDLLTSDDFSLQYAQFRDALADALIGVSRLTKIEAIETVNRAFLLYFAKSLYKRVYNSDWASTGSMNGQNNFEHTLIRFRQIAEYFFTMGRTLLRDLKLFRDPMDKMFMSVDRKLSLKTLLNPESSFFADFIPIYDHVVRYPTGIDSP